MSAQQGKELAKQMLEEKDSKVVFCNMNEQDAYDAVVKAQEALAQAQNALILATRALEKAKAALEEDQFEEKHEHWIEGV